MTNKDDFDKKQDNEDKKLTNEDKLHWEVVNLKTLVRKLDAEIAKLDLETRNGSKNPVRTPGFWVGAGTVLISLCTILIQAVSLRHTIQTAHLDREIAKLEKEKVTEKLETSRESTKSAESALTNTVTQIDRFIEEAEKRQQEVASIAGRISTNLESSPRNNDALKKEIVDIQAKQKEAVRALGNQKNFLRGLNMRK